MVQKTSNRHIQLVVSNFKLIILHYLAANKSGIFDWRRDLCDLSIGSHSVWKLMPYRHLTECNTLRGDALNKHTQHNTVETETVMRRRTLSVMFNVICYARVWRNNRLYHCPMLRELAAVVMTILYDRWWWWTRLCCAWKLPNLS